MYAPMGHIWDIYIYFSVLELKLITHFFLNIQGESKKKHGIIFLLVRIFLVLNIANSKQNSKIFLH